MLWLTIGLFLAGFVLLVFGAEVLVQGSSRLAILVGMTPLVVGQTVVAYGTSAPELAVTIQSCNAGQPDLAMGNVIGSNISNILLVLGISALVRPLSVSRQLVRVSLPVMVIVSSAVLWAGWDQVISRVEGALLAAGAVVYTGFCVRQSLRERAAVAAEPRHGAPIRRSLSSVLSQLTRVVSGIALLVLGASVLVDAAMQMARMLELSELVIGLTVVAIGTSLPEIATSIQASLRNAPDIALGNVVGSNIFNVLLVLGVGALVAPQGVPVTAAAIRFDIPFMIVVGVACLPIFFTGMKIARWEGALFLGYYFAYVAYLLMQTTDHDALQPFSTVMFGFVAPITAVTLAILGYAALRPATPPEPETPLAP